VSSGYIHLWRKIWDDPLFREGRKFSRFEAWVDMILMANGIEKDMLCDGRYITIKRGQLVTSELKLSKRWNWSRTKVRSFLLTLSNNRKTSGTPRIKQQKDNKKSIITILKYNEYNPLKTAEKTSEKQGLTLKIDSRKNIRKTSEKHQKDTNNKDKRKNNKENNLYIELIIAHWNTHKIKTLDDNETKVKEKTFQKIKKWLDDYSCQEIQEGIDNYFKILKSDDHYFSHQWQLWEFLERGLVNFLTKNDPFSNYVKRANESVPDMTGQSFKRKSPEEDKRLALIEKKRSDLIAKHKHDLDNADSLEKKEAIQALIATQVATYSRQLKGEQNVNK